MELELLLGKIYSQWKGHDSQALAAYEAIIRDDPDDFRSAQGLCSLCKHLPEGVLWQYMWTTCILAASL